MTARVGHAPGSRVNTPTLTVRSSRQHGSWGLSATLGVLRGETSASGTLRSAGRVSATALGDLARRRTSRFFEPPPRQASERSLRWMEPARSLAAQDRIRTPRGGPRDPRDALTSQTTPLVERGSPMDDQGPQQGRSAVEGAAEGCGPEPEIHCGEASHWATEGLHLRTANGSVPPSCAVKARPLAARTVLCFCPDCCLRGWRACCSTAHMADFVRRAGACEL